MQVQAAAFPSSPYSMIPPLLLLFLAFVVYAQRSSSSTTLALRLPGRPARFVIFALGALLALCLFLSSSARVMTMTLAYQHPINGLISTAAQQHSWWVKQASQSKTVKEAAREYVRRNGRVPPPGFGQWYEYAVAKSSLIIDDFDSINEAGISKKWL